MLRPLGGSLRAKSGSDRSAASRRPGWRRFLRNNGLSLVMLGLFFGAFFVGQAMTGRNVYNAERRQHGEVELGFVDYLGSPHFGEATAENWESEFFQMCLFVLATAFLYQKGSAESKDPDKRPAPRTARAVSPDAPWPVRRGGWVLRLYEHSLSLALFLLFVIAFLWHIRAGEALWNEERVHDGKTPLAWTDYVASSRFWFESLQNWQSEFLSIGAMVVLSIWLREKDSPESKPVAMPHSANEE